MAIRITTTIEVRLNVKESKIIQSKEEESLTFWLRKSFWLPPLIEDKASWEEDSLKRLKIINKIALTKAIISNQNNKFSKLSIFLFLLAKQLINKFYFILILLNQKKKKQWCL